jgi:polygalacturonase
VCQPRFTSRLPHFSDSLHGAVNRVLYSPPACLCALILSAAPASRAQDRRHVTQPAYPPACATLKAPLTAVSNNRTLPPDDETRPDTRRIQQAIDACQPGRAVELEANGRRNAFLSGPLDLRTGVTLLVRKGVILFASRNPRDYDIAPHSCGVVNNGGFGCKPLIEVDHAPNAAIMGDGVIDGRGWAKLLGRDVSWWDLAQEAKFEKRHQQCFRLIQASNSNNFTLYRITLRNSPNFHVSYSNGDGFTAWGVIIDTPKTARNTDGIDPISSTNVTIAYSYIHAGDDDVAIKAGDAGPSSHITVAHDHFYTGHGMSIGSNTNGGVSGVLVEDLTIDGADNGIRIKSNNSRGGLVRDVLYQNVCIRRTRNPILMDTHYSFYGRARNLLPDFRDITLRGVRILGPGKITLDGYDASHPLGIRFDNVTLDHPSRFQIVAQHADITLGPGPVNFRPSGPDVHVSGATGTGRPLACSTAFVRFPGAETK